MLSIKYSHNGSTKDEIRGHLEIMSSHFQPPLAGRCSIRDYSLKLFIHAQREEAYCDDSLIGLVAYYINGKYAYVSNVSVLPDYSGKGIGSILLNKMESTLIGFGVGIVSMETADNDQSIAFYRKNGFDLDRQLENGMRRMVKYLNSETPLVSIICLVYNHANYLRECFEGFIMQRVNFPIEILVHDDASTDGSAEIIKEYTNRYPQLFKPIFQTINQYSKGVHISATYQYPRCRGKYIAVCEGDDYWSDPLKLQKQVDILENDASIGLVYSDFDLVDFNSNMLDDTSAPKRICNIKQNFRHGYIYDQLFNHSSNILSCTVLYRKNLITTEPIIDHDLFMQISKVSKISFIDEKLAVYRINPKGMMLSDSERVSSYLFRTISNHMIDFYIQKNYIYNVDIKKLKKEVEIFFSKYVTSYIRGNKEASSNIILKIIKIDPLLLIKTPLNILRRLGNNR